ncbi:MAG: hypothetical protein KAJ05_11095 [Candidatus Latescibacteria bacterium]|nr:hypothetical protein [Candidatus Latescibacterota bacterium]
MMKHDKLFESYVTELREIIEAAEDWWDALIAAESERTQGRDAAEAALRERWPFGATSHPWVIATYRKYYLLCEQLNKDSEKTEPEEEPIEVSEDYWGTEEEEDEEEGQGPVKPGDFMVDWLSGAETEDLYEVMLYMVFVPIGIKDGECV